MPNWNFVLDFFLNCNKDIPSYGNACGIIVLWHYFLYSVEAFSHACRA